MSIKKTLIVTLVTAYITSYDVTWDAALGADWFSRAENVDVVKFSPGTLFVSMHWAQGLDEFVFIEIKTEQIDAGR